MFEGSSHVCRQRGREPDWRVLDHHAGVFGLRVEGSGVLGFGVSGSGVMGFRVQRISGLGFKVQGLSHVCRKRS